MINLLKYIIWNIW